MWNAYIDLIFVDEVASYDIALGRAGFKDLTEVGLVFDSLPASDSYSAFMAQRCDASGAVLESKPVNAELVEQLLGSPVTLLIQRGRELATEWREELAPSMVA
ncbi:hypothetical protein LMG667_02635 [Xanthomonas euvesicatoria]|uniref:hypothetical protein n=1 Tax=Xanthomonas euvesicatoria TaxID=456327 RepID=UPI00080DF488|nr:hypothetical protein [Xanthomonas euvesicatoria]OCG90333.1 hypothetical protein LMG667_02635 [Xanthomonas euvesicatoria]